MTNGQLKIKEGTLLGILIGAAISGGTGAVMGGLIGLLADNKERIRR